MHCSTSLYSPSDKDSNCPLDVFQIAPQVFFTMALVGVVSSE